MIWLCTSTFSFIAAADAILESMPASTPSIVDKIQTGVQSFLHPENAAEKKKQLDAEQKSELKDLCLKNLKAFPGKFDKKSVASACEKVELLSNCQSVEKVPIYHFDKKGSHPSQQKILVFSVIHGDEKHAGSVSRLWMERLEKIEPRNSWRVVPVLNPDGLKRGTRANANKVDVNRNFPTKDWDDKAIAFWKKNSGSNPRRFPGSVAGSEPETNCALDHIKDFQPDMVVSIHTPLKVLDYDGPKVTPPQFNYLPWKNLGSYPGSLGRYLWQERKIPVLTMELKEDLPSSEQPFVQLQDIIGFLVSLDINKKTASTN